MSVAPSLAPPLAQLPARGEHLSVHIDTDGMRSQQSLPSGEDSIDEVQVGLDAQTDELSLDEDRTLNDEIEEDANGGVQYPVGPSSSEQQVNSEPIKGEPEPAQTAQLTDQSYGQNDVTLVPDQEPSIEEPIEAPPQTAIETNSSASKTDTILQVGALAATITTDVPGLAPFTEQELEIAPFSEQEHEIASFTEQELETPEVEEFNLNVPSLSEQELSDFAQDVERMAAFADEHMLNEHDSTQLDLQTVQPEPEVTPEPVVESHEEVGAPPLRRMDEDTIPVTSHSKDSIIDLLNDASGTTVDESIQLVTPDEQTPLESEPTVSTEAISEQVDVDMNAEDVVEPEEPASASVVVQDEDVQIPEPSKEDVGEDIVMEQDQVIEQDGEPTIDAIAGTSIDHQPIQITQEGPTPAAQEESTAPNAMLNDTITAPGDAAGPITTVVEESTAIVEEISVEQIEQPGSSTADPVPEVTMDAITTSVEITTVSTDPVVADPVISSATTDDMETDGIERAAQIQREQDATAESTQDETQATLVDEAATTASNTIASDDVPDPTAPKDSDSPLRRALSQSQSQSQPPSQPQLDAVTPQIAGPIDPLVTQNGETNVPEEIADPTKPQDQVSTDQPEATSGNEPSNRHTPEWEGFAALDEDAHGSPEPEPSSEPSEYPDAVDENSPINPTGKPTKKPSSASTDKAKEPSNSPTAAPRARKVKKRKLIMEVVIPIANGKSKVAQETKAIKKRPRGRPPKVTKSAKAPAPVASSSSPQRRSSSADTPSPTPSEASESESEPEPAPQAKKSSSRRRPFGSRKRVKKGVASGSSTSARPVHVAHAAKLEVVIPRKPRPSVLKRVGSTPSGNNVKFAPAPQVTGKRKAESEPEVEDEVEDEDEGTDADADGETDDGYEDVEEEPKVKVEVVISPRSRRKAKAATQAKKSPVKRPRRSNEARKTPTKLPELVNKAGRPSPKRRRLRR